MSATRPPARSPEHELQPEELDEIEELEQIEELGDEAIISQQIAAHALQPRANVSEESRSVVITEHPERRESERVRNPPPRSSAEATLVIRDRRALDEMREKIMRRQRQNQARSRNALYLWGALGLAAFVLGGIVAFLATDTGSGPQTAEIKRRQLAVRHKWRFLRPWSADPPRLARPRTRPAPQNSTACPSSTSTSQLSLVPVPDSPAPGAGD